MRSLRRSRECGTSSSGTPRSTSAFLGIGIVAEDSPRRHRRQGRRSARKRAATEILPRGAVASVGCLFFDAQRPALRDPRSTAARSASPTTSSSRVPVRVGLAAGAQKRDAVLAVARGGVLDVLIIDAPLARSLRAAAAQDDDHAHGCSFTSRPAAKATTASSAARSCPRSCTRRSPSCAPPSTTRGATRVLAASTST